jgi:hypothetical protein
MISFMIPYTSLTWRLPAAPAGCRGRIVPLVAAGAAATLPASECAAATTASAMQRLVDAAAAESSTLFGLLGICILLGLIIAIDRRRRLRSPQSNT